MNYKPKTYFDFIPDATRILKSYNLAEINKLASELADIYNEGYDQAILDLDKIRDKVRSKL